ncbi:MAG: hypothetical protein ACI9CE_000807 [Flavobacterium sp.]
MFYALIKEQKMPTLIHPLTGATYSLQDNGLIEVNDTDKCGLFHNDGRYVSGELKHADLHLLGWLGGKQTPPAGNRHAAAHVDKDS